jgi:hypothetical protein
VMIRHAPASPSLAANTLPARTFNECEGAVYGPIYCVDNQCTCQPYSNITVVNSWCESQGCYVMGGFTCGTFQAPVPTFVTCSGRATVGVSCGPPISCPNGDIYMLLTCGACL